MAGLHDIVPCRIRENSELGLLAVRSAVVYDVASFFSFSLFGKAAETKRAAAQPGPSPWHGMVRVLSPFPVLDVSAPQEKKKSVACRQGIELARFVRSRKKRGRHSTATTATT